MCGLKCIPTLDVQSTRRQISGGTHTSNVLRVVDELLSSLKSNSGSSSEPEESSARADDDQESSAKADDLGKKILRVEQLWAWMMTPMRKSS